MTLLEITSSFVVDYIVGFIKVTTNSSSKLIGDLVLEIIPLLCLYHLFVSIKPRHK